LKKITAIIPTFNEEANIRQCIESVLWCDEVMIIDSFSTDNTLKIAKEYTSFILQREYEYSASQKNFAIPQANNNWILLVDADEVVSDPLKKEIQHLQKKGPDCSAYWIGRDNYFMNHNMKFSGWQGDSVVRFFERDACKYEDKRVHAEIVSTGKIGKLKSKLIHNTYKGMPHFLSKIDNYTTWAAKDLAEKKKSINYYHLMVKPTFRFFRQYILKLGIFDGIPGLIACGLSAMEVFLRHVKARAIIQEQKHGKNTN